MKFINSLLDKIFNRRQHFPKEVIFPKEFIEQVLIKEVGMIHRIHPYISFAVMSIGVEFLGKCLNSSNDWNQGGQSKIDFEFAINNLNSFQKYRPYLISHDLWTSLRNGFLHSFVPKKTLTLSSGNQAPHLALIQNKINLRCEDFYIDFKNACKEILSMNSFASSKMSSPLLTIPKLPIIYSATTAT